MVLHCCIIKWEADDISSNECGELFVLDSVNDDRQYLSRIVACPIGTQAKSILSSLFHPLKIAADIFCRFLCYSSIHRFHCHLDVIWRIRHDANSLEQHYAASASAAASACKLSARFIAVSWSFVDLEHAVYI